MKFCAAVIFSLASASVLAAEPLKDAPARPYYDCMLKQVKKYSRKTDKADEAITAARSACDAKREDLIATQIADLVVQGLSGRQAERRAELAVKKLDFRLRDQFVQVALDAR